ncbi:recombinase family protein [Streptomyces sp. NPDC050485]|uniref:recombinase family protein n=1 Tax=Streptomyces sp. NPDC050485 TaxID=3365617 RepID=UPI00379F21C8
MSANHPLTSQDLTTLSLKDVEEEVPRVFQLGAYLRISDDDRDPVTGELSRQGVTNQLKDCRALAVQLGGEVVKVYDDNDTSASDPYIVRKHFEALLKDLAAGVLDGFVFKHSDRVARQAFDAARVCQIFERNGKLVGRAVTGGTDLSTDNGRAMFVMQAVMGGVEASSIRRRKADANRHKAIDGKDHIGRRAWGWDADGKLVQPYADLRKKAILDIGDGATITQVQADWAKAGITGKNGKPVLYKTVVLRITHPRNCGYKAYMPTRERRENPHPWGPDIIVYDSKGKPVIGKWEPLVTPEEYWRAVRVLEERKEVAKAKGQTGGTRPGHRTHLLSGLVRCGKCGTRLTASARTIKGEKVPFYRCPTTNNGCGGITRSAATLEDHVEEIYLDAFAKKIARQAKRSSTAESTQIAADEARLEEISAEIESVMERRKPGAVSRISTSTAMDLIAELEEERGILRHRVRDLSAKIEDHRKTNPALLKEWEDYTPDKKRHEMSKLIKAIIVEKAPRGRHFDPESVDIAWEEED